MNWTVQKEFFYLLRFKKNLEKFKHCQNFQILQLMSEVDIQHQNLEMHTIVASLQCGKKFLDPTD